MKKNITIKDIAEAVNISLSTVSRALNNHPKISQATKEKVWTAAKKLGYQPNLPVYMERGKAKTIYVLIPVLNRNFYIDILESIQNTAKERGYNIYVAYTRNDPEIEKDYAASLADINAEGIIVMIFDKSNHIDHLNQLIHLNIPAVFINKPDQEPDGTILIPDVSYGTYKAVNHLFSMQCKEIVLFAGNPQNPFYADMIEGFRNAFTDAHIDFKKESVITRNMNDSELEHYLEKRYQNSSLPDGIISPNSNFSNRIVNWLKTKNLKVPDDLLLINFSDNKYDKAGTSEYTSIHFSGAEIGKKAVKQLLKMIKKQKIYKDTIIIPSKFIIKSSSLKLIKKGR